MSIVNSHLVSITQHREATQNNLGDARQAIIIDSFITLPRAVEQLANQRIDSLVHRLHDPDALRDQLDLEF